MKRRDFLCHSAICATLLSTKATAQEAEEALDFCTIMPPEDEVLARATAIAEWTENQTASSTEAGVYRAKRWNPSKRELKVAFLSEGDLADRVFAAARGWEAHMPMRFVKVPLGGGPDIIVGMVPGNGHWSAVGTDSGIRARQGAQSMNFGWTSSPSASDLRRVALHEFGHAMGLVHEQSSPGAEIDWNLPAVYEFYRSTQGWTPEETDSNVLKKYSERQLNRTEYDQSSIMHYPIPRKLVTDPNDVVGWNSQLSDADKAMAAWLWQ